MGVEREEKLSTRQISQLETRVERDAVHVRHVENWKNGTVHERFRSKRAKMFIRRSTENNKCAIFLFTLLKKNTNYNVSVVDHGRIQMRGGGAGSPHVIFFSHTKRILDFIKIHQTNKKEQFNNHKC